MDINYKQDQFELFPGGADGAAGSRPQPHLIFSSMTLSAENIIVLTVFIFLGIIVSFSLGVEKGKRVALPSASGNVGQVAAEQPKPAVGTVVIPKEAVKNLEAAVVAKKEILPPAAPAKIEAAAQDPTGNFYTVQIASYKLRKFAEEEAHGLKAKGYETFIIPKGKHLVVCAGRFLDSGAAKNFLGKLKGKYKDCLVRRL